MTTFKFNHFEAFKLAIFALSALVLTSCTQISGTNVSERMLEIKKQNEALIAQHKETLEQKRLEYNQTVGLTVRPDALAVSKSKATAAPNKNAKPKVRKASVTGALRSSGNININAPWKCVPNRLKSVINHVSKRYGRVVINSTHRSSRKNRRVGGARKSFHLHCQAIDFRVYGNTRGLYAYLRNHPHIGGLKRYRSGYYHIDTGPRRIW